MFQNVYLDSNVLYSDPYFDETFGKLLLLLSRQKKIQVYLSNVVLEETKNNYLKTISEKLELVKKELSKVNKLSSIKIDFDLPSLKSYKLEIDTFYDNMIEQDVIKIVEYNNNFLPEIIKRSINRIKPFTERRQEFRDAIIWLSYVAYMTDLNLSNNILITNNKLDFWDSEKLELHPDLAKDAKGMKIYSGFQEYFSSDSVIQHITKEIEFKKWLDKVSLDAIAVNKIINTKLYNILKANIHELINKLEPNRYFPSIESIYFEFQFSSGNFLLTEFNVTPITNFALVNCTVEHTATAYIYPMEYRGRRYPLEFSFVVKFSFNIGFDEQITLNQIDSIGTKTIA